MGTMSLTAKLLLESVSKQLMFKVIQNDNWFLNFQIVGYYSLAISFAILAGAIGPKEEQAYAFELLEEPTQE